MARKTATRAESQEKIEAKNEAEIARQQFVTRVSVIVADAKAFLLWACRDYPGDLAPSDEFLQGCTPAQRKIRTPSGLILDAVFALACVDRMLSAGNPLDAAINAFHLGGYASQWKVRPHYANMLAGRKALAGQRRSADSRSEANADKYAAWQGQVETLLESDKRMSYENACRIVAEREPTADNGNPLDWRVVKSHTSNPRPKPSKK